jgi:peroxiredoxin Q/BCP
VSKLNRGDIAKDFDLPDANGNPNLIRDSCGRWAVVYFYERDGEPATTKELCQFSDLMGDYARAGVDLYAVSPDDSASHLSVKNTFGIKIPLLSDADHAVMKDYGAWDEVGTDGPIGATILVDPSGCVEQAWYGQEAGGSALEVLSLMQARESRW